VIKKIKDWLSSNNISEVSTAWWTLTRPQIVWLMNTFEKADNYNILQKTRSTEAVCYTNTLIYEDI